MLDLTQKKNVTNIDNSYSLDHWARLFSATPWEDLNILAKENPIIAEATNTINKLTEDELVREACFRRNEQLAHEAVIARKLEQLTEENVKMSAAISEKDAVLSEKDMIIMELKNKLAVLTNNK